MIPLEMLETDYHFQPTAAALEGGTYHLKITCSRTDAQQSCDPII